MIDDVEFQNRLSESVETTIDPVLERLLCEKVCCIIKHLLRGFDGYFSFRVSFEKEWLNLSRCRTLPSEGQLDPPAKGG